jgi:hypothetical protein
MKRGKGLSRNTPLRNTKAISRGTTKLRAVPKYDPAKKPSTDIVKARAGEHLLCEVQIPGTCFGVGGNYHHRINRSQGGVYTPSAALWACGSGTTGCHGWITENPEGARAKGWSIKSTGNPLETPCLYRGEWVLLDDEGGIFPALEFGEAA